MHLKIGDMVESYSFSSKSKITGIILVIDYSKIYQTCVLFNDGRISYYLKDGSYHFHKTSVLDLKLI